MWKLIFLGLIIWLAIYVFKRMMSEAKPSQPSAAKSEESEAENMVQCATCQVHLPRSEAFLVNGVFYCSKAHIPNQ